MITVSLQAYIKKHESFCYAYREKLLLKARERVRFLFELNLFLNSIIFYFIHF